MATYKYQTLTLALLPNDSYTCVTHRTKDDLPAHIQGVTEFHRLGGIGNGYYLPQHLTTSNALELVEFLNNTWFGLVHNPSQKGYFTCKSLQIFPDNKLSLGYWHTTDPQHPEFQPAQTPTVSTSGYRAPTKGDSNSDTEKTPTEHPIKETIFKLAPTFPIEQNLLTSEMCDNQPPPERHRNLEDPPNNPLMNNMAGQQNSSAALQGTAPSIFNGDRSQSNAFLSRFQQYRLLNRNNKGISNLFDRVLTALSYIKGPIVEDWVNVQDRQLERCLSTMCADYIADTSETLWVEFETAFKAAWKDSEKIQSAYEQLM